MKNPVIQAFRGGAIIAVLVNHTFSGTTSFSLYGEAFINFAVALFIFLSGYLSRIHYDDYSAIVKKRFLKVGVPYVLWSLVCCLVIGVHSLLRIALYLLTGKACFPYYFIIVYLQFVVLIYPISKLAVSKYSMIGWLISPLYLLLVVYLPIAFGSNFNEVIQYCLGTSFLAWFIFFYLGLMLGNKLIKINIGSKTLVLLLIISLLFQIAEAYGLYSIGENEMCGTQQKLTANITSVITCLLCCNLSSKEFGEHLSNVYFRLLISIGNCSFGIYLIHILIRDVVNGLAGGHTPSIVLFIMTLTISYIIVLSGRKVLPKNINQIIGF